MNFHRFLKPLRISKIKGRSYALSQRDNFLNLFEVRAIICWCFISHTTLRLIRFFVHQFWLTSFFITVLWNCIFSPQDINAYCSSESKNYFFRKRKFFNQRFQYVSAAWIPHQGRSASTAREFLGGTSPRQENSWAVFENSAQGMLVVRINSCAFFAEER